MSLPIVAIVGRPNVGKSTLFNRMVGSRTAVVDDHPGITRDRLVRRAEWTGHEYFVVDTGGWVPDARDRMDAAILNQVMEAIATCDLILFVVDTRAGLQPHDQLISQELRRRNLPAILVANKTDHEAVDAEAAEFSRLGMEEQFAISSADGRGLGDLLDVVVERINAPMATDHDEPAHESIRVAIVGRPNVGKSSLVNRLLGEERMIVDDKPGTTRDSVDAPVRWHGRTMTLIDTAGIRRRLGSQPSFEFYATLRATRSIDACDVAVLVLDASEPLHRQDLRIADLIHQAGRSAVVLVNKWDLPEKDDNTMGEWVRHLDEEIPFLSHAPKLFVSAKTTQRIHQLPETIARVYETSQRDISTSDWNRVLEKAVEHNPPKSRGRGERPIKIYYATQVRKGPTTVALFCSDPRRMAPDYVRYLAAKFREAFELEGAALRVVLRKS